MTIENMRAGQNRLTILLCYLLLVSCGELKTTAAPPNNSIYIKEFKSFQYPPPSQQWLDNSADTDLDTLPSLNDEFIKTRFQTFNLNNGLEVFFLPRHDLPLVNISVLIQAGKNHADDNDELLSPLVLKLLKQGTVKYSKSEFQQLEALLGMPIKYRQTSQYSVISAEILPQDLKLALELLAEQLSQIKPDDKALRTVIEQQLLENKLLQSSGFYLAKQLFYKNNYPDGHYYSYQQATSQQIKAVSEQELIDFYQRKYVPSNSKIIIAGDFATKKIQQQIAMQFSNWSEKIAENEYTNTPEPAQNSQKNRLSSIDLINRKGAAQVNILYGIVTANSVATEIKVATEISVSTEINVTRKIVSSDWVGLKIIASLLGGGPSSRLFADLREKQGLAYSVSSRQLEGRFDSPFFIQTSVAYEKVVQTIKGIDNHLDYLCQNEIDERELTRLKRQLTGEMVLQFQTNQQLINDKIEQLEMGLPDEYIKDMIQKIDRFTPQELLTIANKYLCGVHNIIVVGEKKKLESDLHRQFKGYRHQTHSLPLQ